MGRQTALPEDMLWQHLPAFMTLALQSAQCRCCGQLLPMLWKIVFGEQRLVPTDLQIPNPSKGLMHLTFWVTRRVAGRKTWHKSQHTHLKLVLALYYWKKNLVKFQVVTKSVWAVREAHPAGAADVSSAPTAAELYSFTVIREFCRQQHCCYQVSSRSLCYQLRISKAGLQKRQVT